MKGIEARGGIGMGAGPGRTTFGTGVDGGGRTTLETGIDGGGRTTLGTGLDGGGRTTLETGLKGLVTVAPGAGLVAGDAPFL